MTDINQVQYYTVMNNVRGSCKKLSECYSRQERAEAELVWIRTENPDAFVMEGRMNFNPRVPADMKQREALTRSLR